MVPVVCMQQTWPSCSKLLQKPTDLDLHCLQRQGISGLSRTRAKQNCNRLHSNFVVVVVVVVVVFERK